MAKGTVTSEEHVDVKLLNGTLTADKLRITGGGEVVTFEGNVVMNLENLNASDQPASPAAALEPASDYSDKVRSSSVKSGNSK